MKSINWRFWIVVGIVLAVSTIAFGRDFYDRFLDYTSSLMSDRPVEPGLPDAELPSVRAVRFEVEHNNVRNVALTAVSVEHGAAGEHHISCHLADFVVGDDWPSLRFVFFDGNGKPVRSVELNPGQYAHADVFSSEQIQVFVPAAPGDQRVSVQAFYPVSP